ncbi:cellulase family glycosylhydrolase [Oleomonas cavernae]|nr:cellulase family glycosylhydrolase [Oleomonas cavernae]
MTLVTLRVSADSWQGGAAFTVVADGQQIGGTFTATADHPAGLWQDVVIDIGTQFGTAGPSEIAVNFINNAAGADGDRNLYIDYITVGDNRFEAEFAAYQTGHEGLWWTQAALYSNGALVFDTTPPPVDPTPGLDLVGISFSGGESTNPPSPDDELGTHYFYPTHAELDYYLDKGLNVIRVAFLWDRIQPTPSGALSASELALLDDIVNYATSRGVKVVLDAHNRGSAYGSTIGSPELPISAFADFWSRMAQHYAANENVMFGLMGEPIMDASAWLQAANAAIAAIRAAGATQTVLVPGVDWDSALGWIVTDNAPVIGTGVVDPADNYVFEVHQYMDADGGGMQPDTVSATIGVDRIRAVTEWARANGQKLFLGEVGANSDTLATTALTNMLAYMAQNSDVWVGVTYWEAGTSYRYYFTISPVDGVDTPQMDVLESFIPVHNDILVGGTGTETLAGGLGNDLYYVNGAGNLVVEGAGQGFDIVLASVSYTLDGNAHVERLAAADAASTTALNLTGNGFDQEITGNAGANKLDGGGGADTLSGLGGNDIYYVDNVGDLVIEAAGDTGDKLMLSANYVLAAAAEIERIEVRSASGLSVVANNFVNRLTGGDGADILAAGGGDDTVLAGNGNDIAMGDAGQDTLQGEAGGDRLEGGLDNDTLDGGAGSDVLVGGAGRDKLKGGADWDLFYYTALSDSPAGTPNRDIIQDFEAGLDRIDLRLIDAVTSTSADNAFQFIGTAAFGGVAGQLRAVTSGNNTIVSADANGDGAADFELTLTGTYTLTAADFLL